jgi:hypothetical protein
MMSPIVTACRAGTLRPIGTDGGHPGHPVTGRSLVIVHETCGSSTNSAGRALRAGRSASRIAGTVRPRTREQPVFFTDAEAARLSPGSVAIILPWPLVGAILAGCVVIAVLTSALPAWFQLRPQRRPSGGIQG